MSNIFEKASRSKIRFNFRGSISAEDLWDLSLEDLNAMYVAISKTLNSTKGEGLLKSTEKSYDEWCNELKLSLIKHVFETLKEEEDVRRNAVADRAIKQAEASKIRQILEDKKTGALSELSEEDLVARLKELEQ